MNSTKRVVWSVNERYSSSVQLPCRSRMSRRRSGEARRPLVVIFRLAKNQYKGTMQNCRKQQRTNEKTSPRKEFINFSLPNWGLASFYAI